MEYNIKQIAGIIGAKAEALHDYAIRLLLTDSRRLSFPEQSLFFALKTKTNDGHKYIPELYQLRVRNFVVSEMRPEFEPMLHDANFLIVKDTLKALQKLAIFHRKRFNIPVIGITGSNGKTIVKEFLYQLLHNEFNIVRSPRSYNSQLGVPLSVWQMNDKHTLGIFEAGISQPDEMERLQPIIAPTIGVITNIGEAHQENFVSTTQKCMEKLSLFNECEAIIYDGDNAFISNCIEAACLSHKSLTWSRTDSEAPLFIESIQKGEEETVITCTLLGYTQVITIPFTDDASIENVIHCIAVMLYLKPTSVNDVEKFRHLEPVDMRLDVKQGINNCMLINDTYNSDINSLDIALDFQQSRRVGKQKTTLILSDILQSGTLPKSLYKKVADLARRKKVDRIIGIGRDLKDYGAVFEMEKEFYLTTEEFIKSPSFRTLKDELILIKGSRHFHFERISDLLEKKVHETILEVNLDAVVHNFNYYRSKLKPETKMVCMVKAFAYGAGSHELAKTLQEHRCDYLAVAVADEGAELRKEGISIPIIVMNPEFSSFNVLFENHLEPEVYSFRLLEAMIHETERRGITSYPIHIKIDTGMHRLGFQPQDVPELCKKIKAQSGVVVRSVFSHLVGSDSYIFDDFTHKQLDLFTKAASELEQELEYKVFKHILNSAGIERFTNYQMDMVRLGIGLYGISASGQKGLRNVSTLKTTILQIQHVPSGDSIGYSRMSYVERDSRIAIIPIGYADGLDRHFSNGKGVVSIHGHRCPIIGNICMDACMIDVTDIDAQEGDQVVIFGEELPVNELSDTLKTIPYEILTSISPRVKRVYYRE